MHKLRYLVLIISWLPIYSNFADYCLFYYRSKRPVPLVGDTSNSGKSPLVQCVIVIYDLLNLAVITYLYTLKLKIVMAISPKKMKQTLILVLLICSNCGIASITNQPFLVTGIIKLSANRHVDWNSWSRMNFFLRPTEDSSVRAITQVQINPFQTPTPTNPVIGGFAVFMNAGDTTTECLSDNDWYDRYSYSHNCYCLLTIHLTSDGKVEFSHPSTTDNKAFHLKGIITMENITTPIFEIQDYDDNT